MKTWTDALRVLPWLAVAISCWPLMEHGMTRGHDWIFELTRVAEYRWALEGLQLPPWWGENLYGGYGSPVFLFYAPLFSAGAALLSWPAGSFETATVWMLVLLSLLGVRLMLGALGEATRDAAAARVGLYVFALHPYVLGDKLVRNADAEFAALCLVPVVLHGALRVGERARQGFVLLSLGLAASILSHNLTALVALAFALVTVGLLYARPMQPRTLGVAAAGVAVGLGLSAFFWVPAAWLTDLVRTDELLTGKFDFHRNFKPLGAFFGWNSFLSAGEMTALVCVASLVALGRTTSGSRARLLLGACLVGMAGLLFMLTSASTFVWETVPLLPLFQFPWRMLGPLALLLAFASALAFALLCAGADARQRGFVELAAFALCVANAMPTLLDTAPLPAEFRAASSAVLSPEGIVRNGLRVTVGHEFLPRSANLETWRTQRPAQGPVVWSRPPADIDVIRESGRDIELAVRARQPTRLRIARWSFPGWNLRLDGEPAPLEANPSGSIDVAVPAGQTRVELELHRPEIRRWMIVLSALSAILWLGMVGRWLREPDA